MRIPGAFSAAIVAIGLAAVVVAQSNPPADDALFGEVDGDVAKYVSSAVVSPVVSAAIPTAPSSVVSSAAPAKDLASEPVTAAATTRPANAPATQPDRATLLRIGSSRFAASALSWPSFSPDGRFIVATDERQPTPIYDAATGVTVAELPPATQTIFLDDQRLAQLRPGGVSLLKRDGTTLFNLAVLNPRLFAASRDGNRLAVASGAKFVLPKAKPPIDQPADQPANPPAPPEPTITLWNTQTGQKIAELDTVFHTGAAVPGKPGYAIVEECGTSVAFDEHGTLLTVASDGHVHLWDGETGKPKAVANIVIDPSVSATLAPDGRSIILPDSSPRRIDLATGAVTALEIPLPAPAAGADDMPQMPPANTSGPPRALTTVPRTNAIHQPRLWYGHFDYSPDGNLIAFRSGNTIQRWDVAAKKLLPSLEGGMTVARMSISRDNFMLASTLSGKLELFNLRTNTSLTPPTLPGGTIRGMVQTPDGSALIVGGEDATLERFDLHTGALTAMRTITVMNHNLLLPVRAVGMSADGNTCWTLSADSMLAWRDTQTLRPISTPVKAPYTDPLTVSDDGDFMIGFAPGGTHGVVVTTNPKVADQPLTTRDFQPLKQPWPAAISPDHRRITFAEPLMLHTETLELNDIVPGSDLKFSSTGNPIDADNTSMVHRPFKVTSMHYAPDGRRIAGISADGPIVFDAIDARVLWVIECPWQSTRHACISDDGAMLAYMDGKNIQIVTMDDGEPIATVPTEGPVRFMQFRHGGHELVLVEHGMSIRVVDWSRLVADTTAVPSTKPSDDWETFFDASPAQSYAALFRLMKQPDALIDHAAEIEHHFGSGGAYGRWIAQLSSSDKKVTESAHQHLEQAGDKAGTAIRHALANTPEGEAHDRLKALSDLLHDAASTTEPDQPPVLDQPAVRYIEALGWLSGAKASDALEKLTQSNDIDIASFAKIALSHQAMR